MHAIIYVAGRANRIGSQAALRHKVLFEFGGKSLLERHVMVLGQLRVPKLYVVTGYLHEQLLAMFPELEARYGVQIEELYNPHFTEGSVISMHASLPALVNATDHVLIMDGDVLYDARMLARLIDSPHPTVLLIDREYSTLDDDPVLVPIQDGRPFEFLKKWKGDAANVGESIGFFKVHASDMPLLIEETLARTEGIRRTESYDEILRALVRAGRFMAEDVSGLPWTEIDFPHDMEYAEKVVVPALQDEFTGGSPAQPRDENIIVAKVRPAAKGESDLDTAL